MHCVMVCLSALHHDNRVWYSLRRDKLPILSAAQECAQGLALPVEVGLDDWRLSWWEVEGRHLLKPNPHRRRRTLSIAAHHGHAALSMPYSVYSAGTFRVLLVCSTQQQPASGSSTKQRAQPVAAVPNTICSQWQGYRNCSSRRLSLMFPSCEATR